MIVPPVISQRYALDLPYLEGLGLRVRDIVQGYCEARGYAFVGRLKTAESLAEKIETGRFSGWNSLDDFYGCAVVIPSLSEEPSTIAFLRERFEEVAIKRRGATLKDPSVFRFDATRFIGRLKREDFPSASPQLLGIQFEVQIRTAFEHAWAVTTHALAYKGDRIDWRWFRLTAQLKAAVEQLDSLVAGFEQIAGTISEHNWPEIDAKRDMEEFFRSRTEGGQIPREVVPGSWARFCDNLLALLLATTKDRVRDPRQLVKRALVVIDSEILTLGHSSFPRSISLLQFVLGVLTQRKFITQLLARYTPLITPELRTLFPGVAILGEGFNWQSTASEDLSS